MSVFPRNFTLIRVKWKYLSCFEDIVRFFLILKLLEVELLTLLGWCVWVFTLVLLLRRLIVIYLHEE